MVVGAIKEIVKSMAVIAMQIIWIVTLWGVITVLVI